MKLNRLSLNVVGLNRIGLNRIGKPSRASSDRPYIDPEVLASLKAVCICYGKSNDDPDRAIVKNLVDPDNPFVISNAAYTEGSGYADKGSPYYGAFVTDGIDDLITSTKSATEMLDGSNEITVVSMIHQIKTNSDVTRNNWFFTPVSYLENRVVENKTGKTGIYGYTSTNVTNAQISDITPILGDKNDYTLYSKIEDGDRDYFTVEGFQNQGIWYVSSIAWYWTIIANKVLTTDQINQVIAYFNLDKYVKPDIYYDVKKQGLTNDNHAQFGDKLIDYSGNSRDLQLNNIAWKGDSGIGKYAADFTSWTTPKEVQKTSDTVKITTEYTEHWVAYLAPNNTFKSMKVLISGIPDGGSLQFFRTTADGGGIKMVNGINEIPEFTNTVAAGFYIDVPLGFDWSNLVIEQIPSHAGALCFDGVEDYGQFVGNLGLKDYTIAVDRAYDELNDPQVPVIANLIATADCPFVFDFINNTEAKAISFGNNQNVVNDVFSKDRRIAYQSAYTYNGKGISKGNSTNTGTGLIAGRYGNNFGYYSKLVLYSLLLFPYSLSEFLIERQLKKRKLGTLYPGMVEFRPIVKSNLPYSSISYSVNPGEYISVDSMVTITVTLPNTSDKLMELSCNAISDISISGDNGVYEITGKIVKSPQKINLVISSYLTMLNNETLISNETLIKNE